MRNILLALGCLFAASCYLGREEIQVKSTYATVLEVTKISRYGIEDRIVLHLRSENNIRFYLEAPMSDTSRYLVGVRYPFLAPR